MKNNKPLNSDQNDRSSGKGENELLRFFIGIILLGVGLFLFTSQVSVSSSWGSHSFFRIAGHDLSNGLVTLPLIIGVIMMFYNPKSMVAKILSIVGLVMIVAAVIMSIHIRFEQTSLYVYLIIIGMIAAGSGMVLRVLFKKRSNPNNP